MDAFARLHKAIDYLKDIGKIHIQRDIVAAIRGNESNVTQALKGNPRYLTTPFLERFARAYSDYINEEWLLTGEGNMAKPAKNMRPHYPASAEAGWLGGDATAIMDYEVEMEPIIKRFPDYDYMIDVRGESMEPTYFDGDSVACRRLYNKNELKAGKTYVFVTRDGAVIKRFVSSTLSSLRVESDNPEYKPYSIDYDSLIDIAEIVGSIRPANKKDVYMHDVMLKYVKSVCLSKLENSNLPEDKRKELIDLILKSD